MKRHYILFIALFLGVTTFLKAQTTRWYNYAETKSLNSQMTIADQSSLSPFYIFPDTTIKQQYSNGLFPPQFHSLANVLDVTSVFFNDVNLHPKELALASGSTFSVDSMSVLLRYNRIDKTVTDTLYVEIAVDSLTTATYTSNAAPAVDAFGVNSIKFRRVFFNSDTVSDPAKRNTMYNAGKKIYKILLNNAVFADSTAEGVHVIKFATPGLPIATAGIQQVASAVKFIPGYSWIGTDILNNKNNVMMFSTEERGYNTFMDYREGDFNISYFAQTQELYNQGPNFCTTCNGRRYYMPSFAYTFIISPTDATWPLENHVWAYKVTCMSGCSKTSSCTTSATITPSGSTTFCKGDSVTLTTASGSSYLWSNGATSQSITVKAAGKYTVTVSDSNACQAKDSITISLYPTSSCGDSVRTNTRWYNYAETKSLYSQYLTGTPSSMSPGYLFPDTTILIEYITSYFLGNPQYDYTRPWIHSLANVLDITSVYFNDATIHRGEMNLRAGKIFTVDSMSVLLRYNRINTYVVDTLYVEIAVGSLPTATLTGNSAPAVTAFGTDITYKKIYYNDLYVSGKTNTLKDTLSIYPAGIKTFKIPLNNVVFADSSIDGLHTIKFATSGLPAVTAGTQQVISAVKFVPGYTWATKDTLSKLNHVLFISSEENGYNTFMNYKQGDFNVSYFIEPDVLYNTDPNKAGQYDPSFSSSHIRNSDDASWPYENHYWGYKVTCTSCAVSTCKILATITPSDPPTICQGDSLTLTASGGSSFLWSNGSTDSSITISPGVTTTYSVKVSEGGCSDSTSVIVTLNPLFLCDYNVWPGDANHDGVANNFDLLAIGVAYGTSGTVRQGATINWEAQFADDWTDFLINGTNYKHTDCNGDGIINNTDTVAIIQNYSFTHNKTFSTNSASATDPSLYLDITNDTVKAGAPVTVQVGFGSASIPAANSYGMAFSINFDPTLIDSASLNFNINNSWMGNKNTNLIALKRTNYSNGTIDIAITRIDHTNINGSGPIGELTFKTSNTFTGNAKPLTLSVGNMKVISNNETIIPTNSVADAVVVTRLQENELQNAIRFYPNPAQDKLMIEVNTPQENFSVKLFNILGMQVYELSEQHSNKSETTYTIDLSYQPEGVYFAVISNGQQVINRKVMVVR